MKLTVKTLRGSHFEIQVHPHDTIMAVKKNIEEVQGKDSYPWGQQLLIHNGKVLKDESTLEENKVSEDGFLVVMLSKSKVGGSSGGSTIQPSATTTPQQPPMPAPNAQQLLSVTPNPIPTPPATPALETPTADTYDHAASNLVAGSNIELTVQHLLEMGGGNWDRDTVLRAFRAAYNNPERAVDYLYSGIPPSAEIAIPVANLPSNPASGHDTAVGEPVTAGTTSFGLPNSAPLDMFPQGNPGLGASIGGGSLDFLRNNQQFQALRAMVQANPQILQPMLQELSKQNPQLLRLIQEHHTEFLQLINEPVDIEGDLFGQEEDMPHAISVTAEEQEAIARLEAMGFDRPRVIEAFLACDRNEELAANYLLEHAADED